MILRAPETLSYAVPMRRTERDNRKGRPVTSRICGDPPLGRSALAPEETRYNSPVPIPPVRVVSPEARKRPMQKLPHDKVWQRETYHKIITHELYFSHISIEMKRMGFTTGPTTISEAVKGRAGARPEIMAAITSVVNKMIEDRNG